MKARSRVIHPRTSLLRAAPRCAGGVRPERAGAHARGAEGDPGVVQARRADARPHERRHQQRAQEPRPQPRALQPARRPVQLQGRREGDHRSGLQRPLLALRGPQHHAPRRHEEIQPLGVRVLPAVLLLLGQAREGESFPRGRDRGRMAATSTTASSRCSTKDPIPDGGWWSSSSTLVDKYGAVPKRSHARDEQHERGPAR